MKDRITTNCNLLPIYHFGEPHSGLLRILNTKINGQYIDYIGIGGRHGVSTDLQCRYFSEIFSIIKSSNNPNVKVHAFGITVPKILESFPFYSADSTTWLQVAINGGILLDDLSVVQVSDGTKFNKNNIQSMHDDVRSTIEDIVSSRGYSFDSVCSDYTVRLNYNIDVMKLWAENYVYKGPTVFKTGRLFM